MMTPEEAALCKSIQEQQVENLDSKLAELGYTGTFAEPFNPDLCTARNETYKTIIKTTIERFPRVTSAEIIYYVDEPAGRTYETRLRLTMSKPFAGHEAIGNVIKSCYGKDAKTYHGWKERNQIVMTFTGRATIEDIARYMSIPLGSLIIPSSEPEDEEILIDLPENPLDIDFPAPRD